MNKNKNIRKNSFVPCQFPREGIPFNNYIWMGIYAPQEYIYINLVLLLCVAKCSCCLYDADVMMMMILTVEQ